MDTPEENEGNEANRERDGELLEREEGAQGAIPTNSPIGMTPRFQRNPNPIEPPPLLGGHMPPAKMRPGNIPHPTLSDTDPTKSPTPAADGETHLPLGQRSQAIPTAATLRREAQGDGFVAAGSRTPVSHVEAEQMEHDNAHEGAGEDGGTTESHVEAPEPAPASTTAGRGRRAAAAT